MSDLGPYERRGVGQAEERGPDQVEQAPEGGGAGRPREVADQVAAQTQKPPRAQPGSGVAKQERGANGCSRVRDRV